MVSRSLILWNDVAPTSEWIDLQIPSIVKSCINLMKKALIFASCILRKKRGVHGFQNTKPLIWARLNDWEAGRICALVNDVCEDSAEEGWGMGHREFEVNSAARRYNSMVLDGKIRSAVRTITDRDPGGLLAPDDIDSKSGDTVIDVLRGKHPDAAIPFDFHFDEYPEPHPGEGLMERSLILL